jgi:hypothetical protein
LEFLHHTRGFERSLGELWKRGDEEGEEEGEEGGAERDRR